MSIFAFPLNNFKVPEVDEDMGDLEFLQGKEDAGELLSSSVILTNVGTSASIIPAIGKTFYPTSASALMRVGALTGTFIVQLQNDGTMIDSKHFSGQAQAALSTPFTNIMRSLVGDGIKVYRIQTTTGGVNTTVSGSIEGYVV